MITKAEAMDMAWEFARVVAEIDKQLLSTDAVAKVAAMVLMAQEQTAERCAEILKGGADVQREHAARCKAEGKWMAKEMSVTESGTEAYLTATNALDFWEYQIRREFGVTELRVIPTDGETKGVQ